MKDAKDRISRIGPPAEFGFPALTPAYSLLPTFPPASVPFPTSPFRRRVVLPAQRPRASQQRSPRPRPDSRRQQQEAAFSQLHALQPHGLRERTEGNSRHNGPLSVYEDIY